jgi:hypothetical protein
VVRDTREKDGKGWTFAASPACAGTVEAKLETGDYALQGLEGVAAIDRKGSAVEFVGNLYDGRFHRELERMKAYELAVVVLEFDYDKVARWHECYPKVRAGQRVPRHWTVPGAVQAKFMEVQLAYPHVSFLFAGPHGRQAVSSLFKRVWAKHGPRRVG